MTVRPQQSVERKDQGFTLIELLVVIVIIGILAAVAIPMFLNQRQKGIDSGVKSDLKNAATAAETYTTEQPSAASFATTTPAATEEDNLKAAGFKPTTGNTIEITGGPAGGYCLRGFNPAGTAEDATVAFWYDSVDGGLLPGKAGAGPATGLCKTGTFVPIS